MSMRWVAVAVLLITGLTAAGWGYVRQGPPEVPTGSPESLAGPSMVDADQWAPAGKGPIRPQSVSPLSTRSLPFDLERDHVIPDGTAAGLLATLTPQANAGDEVAARQLYLVLQRCRVASAQDVSPQAYPDGDPQMHEGSGLSREGFIARFEASRLSSIEKTMAWCEGVSDAQIEQRGHWLRTAAEGGDITARLTYAIEPQVIIGDAGAMLADPAAVQAYREDAVRYTRSVDELGIHEGLQQMAGIYGNGLLTERDPVLAYAYADVASSLRPSAHDAESMGYMARAMTPRQREQAQHEAHRIRAALRESAAR